MNKKILFVLSITGLFAFLFVGCENSSLDIENSSTENESQNIELRDLPTGYKFMYLIGKPDNTYPNLCDQKKSGMCLVYVESIEVDLELSDDFQSTPILTDDGGNDYVEIAINQDLIFEDEEKNLYINEPIIEKASDGTTYILDAGVYQFDYELGDMGGYTLPLIKA